MRQVVCIGAGNITSGYDEPNSGDILTHAHAINNNNAFNLAGFYDIEYDKCCKASAKWGGKAYHELEKACKDADIYCLAVPDFAHYDVLKRCLSYKKPEALILEKPIATSIDHGKQIIRICYEASIPVFVNYSRQYSDSFDRMQKWIKEDAGLFLFGFCTYGKGLVHNASHLISLLLSIFKELRVKQVDNKYNDFYSDDFSFDFMLSVGQGDIFFRVVPNNYVTDFGFELFFKNGKVVYNSGDESIVYYTIGDSHIYKNEKNYCFKCKNDINVSSYLVGLYSNIEEFFSGSTIKCSIENAIETLKICDEIKRMA